MESKTVITKSLYELLTLTNEYHDELVSLEYIHEREVVVAKFHSGSQKTINVNMDSGIALIRDVVKGLEENEWDH